MLLSRGAVLWQRWLLALCAFGFVSLALNVWSETQDQARRGYYTVPSGTAFLDRIGHVIPGGPAADSGLRDGDLVALRALSPAERIQWRTGMTPHERMSLSVIRNGVTHDVAYTSGGPARIRWDVWLYDAGAVWMLLFAALIAWRRPQSAEAHILCLILTLMPIGIFWQDWRGPWPLATLTSQVLFNSIYTGAVALLAAYCMLFARPPAPLRRVLACLSYVSAVVTCAWYAVSGAGLWFGFADPYSPAFYNVLPLMAFTTWLLPLLCVLATIPATKGQERGRIVWTTLTLGWVWVFSALSFVVESAWPDLSGGPFGSIIALVNNCVNFMVPIGMTYALFNRRVLDLGFALNRAVIFSGVSLVIVGAFVLGEWLISEWLRNASHTTNLAVTGALALGLGLSIHVVHKRIEHVVDNVFFRKRRSDEDAIRSFAREAPYITDAGTLLARTAELLSLRADAATVEVLLHRGTRYGNVSENDPAIVALRARHERLDLHAVETAIQADFAYPMVARGRLVGALALGPKRSGESYAPDESAAIAQLAHAVAGAVDVLSLKQKPGEGDLAQSVTAMTEVLGALTAEVRTGMRALTEELRRTMSLPYERTNVSQYQQPHNPTTIE